MRLIDADAITEDERQEHGFFYNSDLQELLDEQPTIDISNTSNTLGALDCVERRLVSYKLTDLVNEFEEILSHIREREENDSVCGLCEYDGAYMGQSGDWCNECPGFDKADCFKLKDKYKKEWLELMNTLPSVQPEFSNNSKELEKNSQELDNKNGELISRQEAVDEIEEWIIAFRVNGHKESAADACLIRDGIIQLPSVPRKGKWIDYSDEGFVECPLRESEDKE